PSPAGLTAGFERGALERVPLVGVDPHSGHDDQTCGARWRRATRLLRSRPLAPPPGLPHRINLSHMEIGCKVRTYLRAYLSAYDCSSARALVRTYFKYRRQRRRRLHIT